MSCCIFYVLYVNLFFFVADFGTEKKARHPWMITQNWYKKWSQKYMISKIVSENIVNESLKKKGIVKYLLTEKHILSIIKLMVFVLSIHKHHINEQFFFNWFSFREKQYSK